MIGGISVRKAAERWAVPRSTIQARTNGTAPRKEAFEPLKRLSAAQESHLVSWILIQDAIGNPPTHEQVRKIASRLCHLNGDNYDLGKSWLHGFLNRNPEIKTLRGKRLDFERLNGASTYSIQNFFKLLTIKQINEILPQNRYNMDETGLAIGLRENGLVLGSSQKRIALKRQSGQRFWSTIFECISATGTKLNPLVLFDGKSVQQQWFPDELRPFENWYFEASSRGWTNNTIAVHWLKTIFIPETKPTNLNERRLLIIDGHGSHCTAEFLYECYHYNIYLLFLPAHSSHVLQPLDVAVFSAVKTSYRKELGNRPNDNDSSPVGKRIFLECYAIAREAGITEKNIRLGWRTSGLWPVSIAKPLMSKLLLDPVKTTPEKTPQRPPQPLEAGLPLYNTPANKKDLRNLLNNSRKRSAHPRSIRLMQRKIEKQFDVQRAQIIIAERQNQELEDKIKLIKPKKRQTVVTNPNTLFVQVIEVENTRRQLDEQLTGIPTQPIIEVAAD